MFDCGSKSLSHCSHCHTAFTLQSLSHFSHTAVTVTLQSLSHCSLTAVTVTLQSHSSGCTSLYGHQGELCRAEPLYLVTKGRISRGTGNCAYLPEVQRVRRWCCFRGQVCNVAWRKTSHTQWELSLCAVYGERGHVTWKHTSPAHHGCPHLHAVLWSQPACSVLSAFIYK